MGTEAIRIVVSTSGAQGARRDLQGIGVSAASSAKEVSALGSAIKALVAGAAARELVKIVDSYTDMGNRLRLVTRSADELRGVQSELFRVANDNRTSALALGEVYQSLANSTKSLGLSQREVLDLTEELTQATVISGASADAAANSLRQLGQGLASGALRGEEFNSVSENTPEIMRIIGQSLKKNQGELRAFGAEGKITGAIIVKAFSEARAELAEKMLHTVPTLGQAFTVVGNVVTRLVGEIDQATGASHGLSGAIIALARDVNDAIPEFVRFATSVTDAFADLAKEATGFSSIMDSLGLPPALTFIELTLANIIDRFIAASQASAIFYRTISGQGGAGDTLDAFMSKLKTAALTGNGAISQGIMENLGVRQGSTTVNAERGDPANRGLRNTTKPPVDKGPSFAEVLRGLTREHDLLEMNAGEAEIARGIDAARSQLKGKLTQQQVAQLDYQLRENQLLQVANDSIDRRLQDELKLIEAENEHFKEISDHAGAAAAIGAQQAAEARGDVGARALGAANGFEGTVEVMGQERLSEIRTFGEEMAAIFGPGGTLEQGLSSVGSSMADLVGHAIAFGDSWGDVEQSVKRLGQSILAEVISALIQTGVQMAVNAALGQSFAAAAVGATVAEAAAVGAAWSAPAAFASTATLGGAAAAGTAGLTAAVASAKGMQLASLVGFESGGYTGDGSPRGVAGLVHGREFVVNAEATARNRQALEAMNSGNSARGGGIHVNLINQAPGVEHEVTQADDGRIEIVARRVLQQHGPDVIAADMRSPHGKTGRAMISTTTAQRRRS